MLTVKARSRVNETSVLLPATNNGDDRAMASIEMTQLSDGKAADDRASLKSLCSDNDQNEIVTEKTVQFTDTSVDTVAGGNRQSSSDSVRVTKRGAGETTSVVDCGSCFTRCPSKRGNGNGRPRGDSRQQDQASIEDNCT